MAPRKLSTSMSTSPSSTTEFEPDHLDVEGNMPGHLSSTHMRFDIVTIFPGFFTGFLENGILRRALAEGLVEVAVHDLRNFTHDRHRTVDDRPFGGGEGMVLKPQPIAEALASLGIEPKLPATSRSPKATTLTDRESSAPANPETSALCQGTTSVVPQ